MRRPGARHFRLRISCNLDNGQVRQARTSTQHIPSDGLVFVGSRILLFDAKGELGKSATHRILRLLIRRILWSRQVMSSNVNRQSPLLTL